MSKGKRDQDQNDVQTLRDRQHLHKILETKAELAVRGEKLAQQRLCEAEADVEVKHWEKRNSDTALHEINQEFESQQLQLQQANQSADQAGRDKISLYEELEMSSQSNPHYSESHNHALPRFWIAARYTEYCGYFRKRF